MDATFVSKLESDLCMGRLGSEQALKDVQHFFHTVIKVIFLLMHEAYVDPTHLLVSGGQVQPLRRRVLLQGGPSPA